MSLASVMGYGTRECLCVKCICFFPYTTCGVTNDRIAKDQLLKDQEQMAAKMCEMRVSMQDMKRELALMASSETARKPYHAALSYESVCACASRVVYVFLVTQSESQLTQQHDLRHCVLA